MKQLFFILITLVVFVACNSTKKLPEITVDIGTKDSIEYEMIVMDPGFETWFITNSKPDWYRSLDYYENWNRQYTHAWNAQLSNFSRGHLLSAPINYDDNVDYGLEINHKLFYYFQYVERVLRIPILKAGPGYVGGI